MEEVPGLNVPLRSIPFRRPYASLPTAVRSVCFSRQELTVTSANGDDPLGYSHGWFKLIDVSDPRQWFTDGASNVRPEDWDEWADLYSLFLVTKARVWVRMQRNSELTITPSKFGYYSFNQPTFAKTKAEFQGLFSGRNAAWTSSWLQNANMKMHWKNLNMWEPTVSGGGTGVFNKKPGVCTMYREIDVTDLYKRTMVYPSASATGQWAMNFTAPWAPTSYSTLALAQRPLFVPSLMFGCGTKNNSDLPSAHQWHGDVLIQWDVVFAGPVPVERDLGVGDVPTLPGEEDAYFDNVPP